MEEEKPNKMNGLRVQVAFAVFCLALPASGQTLPSANNLVDLSQGATFRDSVNLVLLDVSVRNRHGGFVSNLQKKDFRVLEDGKPQTITQFANADLPVTVGLVVDSSGSMRQKRPEVITAALVFIQASNPQDEIFVVNFNDDVKFGLPPSMPFSGNIAELRSALWMGDPDGRTRLYDAILASLDHLKQGTRGKKALLVVSDGGDNFSTHTFDQTLRAVEESRATIYTLGTFDENDPDRNPRVLHHLANVSGGVAYLPRTLAQVPDICRQIAKDIRTRYTIGYIPGHMDRPGQRHIRVEVSAPGYGKLIPRTRTVYRVPGTGSVNSNSTDESTDHN